MIRRSFLIVIVFILHKSLGYCQVDEFEILNAAITFDSLGYYQEVIKNNNELLYIRNEIFAISDKKEKEYFFSFNLKIINKKKYSKLRSRQKRKKPIIYFNKILINANIITYNVIGAVHDSRYKKKDYFFGFSNLLISYKFNCKINKWEQFEIKYNHDR